MSRKNELVIRPESPEAAQRKTVTAWVDRDGRLWSDDAHGERMARYCGSTHSACSDCGATCGKGHGVCDACRERRGQERFAAMPREAWDGHQMIYSEAADRYFSDPGEAESYLEEECEEGQTLHDLKLILCKPNHARQLDDDYFCDEMSEDGDLPNELVEAMEAFNKAAAACRPLSWSPGKKALLIDDAAQAGTQGGA